jgi:hypothetical protein
LASPPAQIGISKLPADIRHVDSVPAPWHVVLRRNEG